MKAFFFGLHLNFGKKSVLFLMKTFFLVFTWTWGKKVFHLHFFWSSLNFQTWTKSFIPPNAQQRSAPLATQFQSKKTLQRWRTVGNTTLCPIWPAWDLNLRPPAPETNALPLDQLANDFFNVIWICFLFVVTKPRSNLLLYLLWYYAEARNEFAGPIYVALHSSNTAPFWRYVAAVASRWRHCIRFDLPKIWTSDHPLHRWLCYRSTNQPVCTKLR